MGRVFSSTRSLNPMGVDKLKNAGTAKQLRSARTILGKSESKLGRSPTRKLSGRKTYERQRATATNASPLVQLRHRGYSPSNTKRKAKTIEN